LPEDGLLARILELIAELPTYGYCRIHALLRQQAELKGSPPPNRKRVWRVMKPMAGSWRATQVGQSGAMMGDCRPGPQHPLVLGRL
jgi:hypothetical protein